MAAKDGQRAAGDAAQITLGGGGSVDRCSTGFQRLGMVAGDTAISADIVDATTSSLVRVIPVMLAVIFVVIAIYLRALVAPIYLVLSSVLAPALPWG